MIVLAYCHRILVLRRLVNQEGIAVHVDTRVHIFLRASVRRFGAAISTRSTSASRRTDFFSVDFSRRDFDRSGGGCGRRYLRDSVTVLAIFFHVTRVGRALRAVATITKPRASGGIPLNYIWLVVGRVRHRRDRCRYDLGLQARCAILDFAGRAQGAASADPRRSYVDTGSDRRRIDHRRREARGIVLDRI